ncbi:hypothetical protein GCU67_20650 [Modestobacter muralis]|uniref:DUF4913 domain-containing protein n=1 Tax=Modestobacter muralis TaxID=1608614 RepID=A0A6P0F1K0_9ACTN|nr:hypothetical protein [Modestobacter muralis]NEK96556.1 hypothetical protein [Modestobacter muralis]NEN53456.1 hypothetical protein [Modestobacter muralis]
MTGPLWVRCGVDVDHETHPHDGGMCDGGRTASAADAVGGDDLKGPKGIAGLLAATGAPRPWSLDSLTETQREELAGLLVAFVDHLNTDYAVSVTDLVLPCWPQHPRLVHDLASLYSGWVDIHQTLVASPERGMYWHDRWLPNFQQRLKTLHFGKAPDACTPNGHKTGWNAAAEQLETLKPANPGDVFAHIGDNPAWLNGTSS